jgi:hypothetical protein
LTCGDKNIPVARVAPPIDNIFTVEILINEDRPINAPNLKSARASLNLYLVEKEEPECVFRSNPDTHSDLIRTPVLNLSGHLF